PWTVLRPTRTPVKEPGPRVTAYPSTSRAARPAASRTKAMVGRRWRECPPAARSRTSPRTTGPSDRATLSRSLVVSTARTFIRASLDYTFAGDPEEDR